MTVKRKIKEILCLPLYDLIKYWTFRIFKGSYFAHNSLDKKLKNYLNYNEGYFVELGANNGYSQSNTLYFEIKKNWNGILVEPSPNLYLKCFYFRNSQKNHIYCNACVDFSYNKKYVDMCYGDLMSTSESLFLDIPNRSNYNNLKLQSYGENHENLRFGSEAITLHKILKKSKAPKIIDFLSIDVEGAEFSVLGGIDFSKYNFKYILVESRVPKKVKSYLSLKGYKFLEKLSDHDLLFGLNK